ncbi:MAG: acetoin utilization protein AcuC [Thermoleophilia bacterium]
MSSATAYIYSDTFQKYELGPWHPMKPVRLMLTAELMRAYGLPGEPNVRELVPRVASDEELRLIHGQDYIDAVRALSVPGAREGDGMGWGLGTGDNPIFVDMHEASATIAGGAIQAADLVMGGELDHVFHFAGGLHHARRDRASGFCVYNDAAIAAAHLKAKYGARVLYIDIDAHHGDGVQDAFYGDPGVMTISFHESGRHLFPGTGYTGEAGDGAGQGYSVNLPLEPFTTDEVMLDAYDALVPALARAFQPDIIITQNGCDAHWSDPLAHLSLTMSGYGALAARLHALAHEVCGGRWLATGGGGYQAYTVVPRVWTQLMGEMAGVELPEELPEEWRELCGRYAGNEVPLYLTRDDHAPPVDAATLELIRAVTAATVDELRETVFPLVGA